MTRLADTFGGAQFTLGDAVLLATALIAATCIAAYYYIRDARLYRHDVSRFAFFALRDRLVRLAITGVMKRDDPVFEHYYSAAHAFAHNCNSLDRNYWIRAILLSNVLPSEKAATFKRHLTQVRRRPQPFRGVVALFYAEMLATLLRNSTYLRWAWRLPEPMREMLLVYVPTLSNGRSIQVGQMIEKAREELVRDPNTGPAMRPVRA